VKAATRSEPSRQAPTVDDTPPTDGDRHVPDCPAVNPRPALKSALAAPVETGLPADGMVGETLPPPINSPTRCRTESNARPPGDPSAPLFISLCVLRI
jgi:hypothetical protein